MYALQIYGQLRTFKESLPSLLRFIDFHTKEYDVFLFIDKCGQCTSENIDYLHTLFQHKVKVIQYVQDHDISMETGIKENYDTLWKKFNAKMGNVTHNGFVCSLKYRTYLLNQLRLNYEAQHNITYEYIVRSRFDYGTSWNGVYSINETTTPMMCSDCLTIAKPEFVNKESELGLHYPFTPTCLFDENCEIVEKYEKYKDWRGDKFIDRNWIFMPELNQRLFLLEQSMSFIEAWWEEPCNYGFRIIR